MLLGQERHDQGPHDTFVRPLDRPAFPNLRCKEIIKAIVEAAVDAKMHGRLNDEHDFTLGLIRGAIIVADQTNDKPTYSFLRDLLQTFAERGKGAVYELIETVRGKPTASSAGD